MDGWRKGGLEGRMGTVVDGLGIYFLGMFVY
jgi:hypothetical protein